MDKEALYAAAINAAKKLVKDRGADAHFPADALWKYAETTVPSLMRPGLAVKLENEGYIELTGNWTRAESDTRAGSPTREYRPGPGLLPAASKHKHGTRKGSVPNALLTLVTVLESKGLIVSAAQLTNFYLALLSSPMVIMAGVSGSGKSRLPRLFAESIGAHSVVIPVKPQWDDNSDLFGYTSAIQGGTFNQGPFTTAVLEAMRSPALPFIVLLDEMNLAVVEHYFSDFLSVIETRRREKGAFTTDALLLDLPPKPSEKGKDAYAPLRDARLPENIKIVGTANMDETTRTFSPKVLDRAFSIESDEVDLTKFPVRTKGRHDPADLRVLLDRLVARQNPINVQDVYETEPALCEEIAAYMEQIRTILRLGGISFAYRPRDAACLYMWHWKHDLVSTLLPKEAAIDYCILQKVLPKIYGQGQRLQDALENLHRWLLGEPAADIEPDASRQFLRSSEKVERMIQRLKDEGATTYWGT